MQKTQFSFLLSGDKIYFDFPSLTYHKKKKKKRLKNSHLGQIQVQFVFCKVSYWDSVMKEHAVWTHISQLSHWTALWSFRTTPLHNPQSALQFMQYQDPFPDFSFNNSLSPSLAHDAWRRFSQSTHSTPYPMPCNIFCKGGIETRNLGSFRCLQPGWEEWSK